MDDAIKTLASKVAARLAANETAHISSRNLSSLGAADVAKLQNGLDRALRKRLRNPAVVELSMTISENLRSFLAVAQIRQDVEMAAFSLESRNETPRASISKTILWQQDEQILDIAAIDDEVLILDVRGLTRYDHRERAESAALNMAMPRDPRGSIEVRGDALLVRLPGATCGGAWKPLAIACEPGGDMTPGRNTIADAAWPPHYAHLRVAGDDLLTQTDGKLHIYNPSGPGKSFDLGSDMAAACGGSRILASGAGDRESQDFVALYEIAGGAPARVSDPVEFPGPVTSLSSGFAVARNLSTGRYEAYSLQVDCGR